LASPATPAVWARRACGTVCSFEMLLVLFLFAGRYKNDPRFEWFPVDITAAMGAASALAGAMVLYHRGGRVRRPALVLGSLYALFAGYAGLSLLWTPGVVYAHTKAFYLATLVLWALLSTAAIVAYDRARVRRFLVALVIFAGMMGLESTLLYLRSGFARVADIMGSNYLGVGRCVGPAALVVLGYLLYEAKSRRARLVSLLVLGWLFGIVVVLPGRGPLIATVVPMALPLLGGLRLRPGERGAVELTRSAARGLGVALLGAGALIAALLTTRRLFSLLRFATLFSQEGGGLSAGARVLNYRAAVLQWLQQPLLGHGIGAWPILAGVPDIRSYPHDILLETLAELGLVGAVLLVGVIVYAFRSLGTWAEIKRDKLRLVVLMLVLNTLLNALVSGDLPDNRFAFAALGLMVLPWGGSGRRA